MSYTDLIHTTELLASRLSEQDDDVELKKNNKKSGGHYKAPNNFKAFEDTIVVKLVKILGMSSKTMASKTPTSFFYYHEGVGHNTSECRDLLRSYGGSTRTNSLMSYSSNHSRPTTRSWGRQITDKMKLTGKRRPPIAITRGTKK